MIPLQQPEDCIRSILQNSEWPVSFDEIVSQIIPFFPEPTVKNIYSPMRVYTNGQRLYHPAEGFKAWFTVEVQSKNRITAHFDDGNMLTMIQGDPKYSDFAPEKIRQHIQPAERVDKILSRMPDVQKIGPSYAFKTYLDSFPLHQLSNIPGFMEYIKRYKQITTERIEQKTSILRNICQEYDFHSLWYLVHLDNLPSILENGILARNLAPEGYASFANEDIQSSRHTMVPDKRISFTLHDYVPVFFSARPPLLYNFVDKRDKFVKIQISTDILLTPGAVFFDMNARSPKAHIFFELGDLAMLNWTILRAERWNFGEEGDHTRSLYRQAEADIPLRIQARYFESIVVSSRNAIMDVNWILRQARKEIIPILDNHFF